MKPGPVLLSSAAHRHIATDHPGDYADCMAAMASVVASPTFIGQGPTRDNFEMVRRINHRDGKAVLVAVSLTVDSDGCYRVRTSYLISETTVNNRRAAGRLLSPYFK